MRIAEWLEIVEWMTVRWSSMATKPPIVIEAMYEDLRMYEAHDVSSTVQFMWRSGRETAPSGAAILSALKASGVGPAIQPSSEVCDHVWALPRPWEQDEPSVCARCRTERKLTFRKEPA